MPVMDTINPGVLRFWDTYSLSPASGVQWTSDVVYKSCLNELVLFGECVIEGAAGDVLCTLPSACRPSLDLYTTIPGYGWTSGQTVADRHARDVGIKIATDGTAALDMAFNGSLKFSSRPISIASRIYAQQQSIARAYIEQWAAASGQTAIAVCLVYGGEPTSYQWQYKSIDGSTWYDSSASSGRTYRYVNTSPGNTVVYRCKVGIGNDYVYTNETKMRSD